MLNEDAVRCCKLKLRLGFKLLGWWWFVAWVLSFGFLFSKHTRLFVIQSSVMYIPCFIASIIMQRSNYYFQHIRTLVKVYVISILVQVIARIGCLLYLCRSLGWMSKTNDKKHKKHNLYITMTFVASIVYMMVIELPFRIYFIRKLNAFYLIGLDDANKQIFKLNKEVLV